VREKLWLGIGADFTPTVETTPPEQPDGFVFWRTTGQHAHDIFMHTWYELGVFGAILVAITSAVIALCILLLPATAQPYAAGRSRCLPSWRHSPGACGRCGSSAPWLSSRSIFSWQRLSSETAESRLKTHWLSGH
jgi:hypothetical protein